MSINMFVTIKRLLSLSNSVMKRVKYVDLINKSLKNIFGYLFE